MLMKMMMMKRKKRRKMRISIGTSYLCEMRFYATVAYYRIIFQK
jgi:hypothetical protein